MEDIPKLKIKIRNFRAIKSADIILNGITVVTGINGSGKSTISKLIYRTIKTSIDFEKIITENLSYELRDIRYFIDELSNEVERFYRGNIELKKKMLNEELDFRYKIHRLFSFSGDLDLKEQEERVLSAIDFLSTTYSQFRFN